MGAIIIFAVLLIIVIVMFIVDDRAMKVSESFIASVVAVCVASMVVIAIAVPFIACPTANTIRESKAICEMCIEAHDAGQLSDAEDRALACKIFDTNKQIRFFKSHQKGWFCGVFISDEEIGEIPLEPWMETILAHENLLS